MADAAHTDEIVVQPDVVDAFVQCARSGDVIKLKEFIDGGIDVNAFSAKLKCTALMAASFEQHIECVKLLLARHAVRDIVDSEGYAALHWAAASWHDDPAVIHTLVFNGHEALLALQTSKGNTPLHRAAAKGNVRIVEYILHNKGARIHAKNHDGLTALELATAAGQTVAALKISEVVVCTRHGFSRLP
jgi:ankyrin repeat protein